MRYLGSPLLYAGHWLMSKGLGRRQGLNILLFHDIPANQQQRFETFIRRIQKTYGIVTPEAAEAWLRDPGRPSSPNDWPAPCLLTFDDGFESNFRIATDIFERLGIKALFFVCPGLIDIPADSQSSAICAHMFRGRRTPETLPPELKLMTWAQINELITRGHTIGCHGLLHQKLTTLSFGEVETEVLAAAEKLVSQTGVATPWYAYAFGDIDSVDANAMSVIGRRFPLCRSGVRGLNTATTLPLGLLSESIEPSSPLAYQHLILEGGMDIRYRKAREALARLAEHGTPVNPSAIAMRS